MKTSFKDLRKKSGSIADFADCKRNFIFLTEEDEDDVI